MRRQPSAAVLPRAERGIVDGRRWNRWCSRRTHGRNPGRSGKATRGPASFPAGFDFNEPSAFGRRVGARALPLRIGPEIQDLLRCALTGGSATTERMRRGFVVVGVWNRAMCHPGMAERHGITAGSDEMNKTEMADRLAARAGLSKGAARDAVDGVFAIVGEALADGEEVRLPGFGTFGTRSRPARTGRNPRTGEAVAISASTSPTFKPGKTLKDTVNAGPRS